MARDFNQFRNANAKLGQENITTYGKTYAIQYGLDGFSAVNNVVAPMPTDIKEYLEGDTSITIYACASNIDKLCEYALASFPNIEYLYLFKTSAIVVLEDDLSYLLDLNKIYVPSDLLSAYISAYPTLSSKFDTIVEDYTLTIPFIGETTLTSEYVDSVIAMLSSAEKNAITKLVIPTDFSQASADEIAWGYDFSAIVNLNNNFWYGSTKYDFSVFTIQDTTQDHILTANFVSASLNSISSDKLTLIEKVVVPVDFTSYASGSITELQAFMTTNSIDNLVTCYEYGNIELDLQGEVVAKIISLGKTLDVELSNARSHDATSSAGLTDFSIIPPLNITNFQQLRWENRTNLVYLSKLKMSFSSYIAYFTITENTNLIYMDIDISEIETFSPTFFGLYGNSSLKYMYAYGVKKSFDISSSTQFTRETLVYLFNSLGTPATQQTLKIGATNLAKLTVDDIAIATAKNWNVVA